MEHQYTIKVSHPTFMELRRRLIDLGAQRLLMGGRIEMSGIHVVVAEIPMDLLPFNHYEECPKCGASTKNADARYGTTGKIASANGDFISTGTQSDPPMPHLVRHCTRCRYGWLERTKDGG
jgi:hypothetical protein